MQFKFQQKHSWNNNKIIQQKKIDDKRRGQCTTILVFFWVYIYIYIYVFLLMFWGVVLLYIISI